MPDGSFDPNGPKGPGGLALSGGLSIDGTVTAVDADSITLLATPGATGSTLSGHGECLVVRAERAGSMEITVAARDSRGSLDAELRLRLDTPDEQRAEAGFRRALETAGRQQAKSWELRAATSLARLWGKQGRQTEAR